MSILKFKAAIMATANDKHPDCDAGTPLSFTDTYTIDTDRFMGYDGPEEFIHEDMALVLGGGYDTTTLDNVNISITAV